MKKVLVLLANGFEVIEALSVVDVCSRAGVICHTCGITSKEVKSSHGVTVICDRLLDHGDLMNYDAIVLPGGMPGATNLRDNIKVIELVKEYNSSNKIVAAICAAPIVLERAGIIDGKRVTSYPGFNSKLDHCIYKDDEAVVVDENIITSRGPATALMFALEIINQLGYIKEVENIKEGMLINFLMNKED